MSLLLDPDLPRYTLGHTDMDDTHRAFIDLLNQIADSGKQEFPGLFQKLIEYTEQHFEMEEQLMSQSAFPAWREHEADHQRVLGDLHRFGQRMSAGSTMMGRAYICEQLPQWFDLHAATMDSALAAHLNAIRQTA